MQFSQLELLFLRRLVASNIDLVSHRIQKYTRYQEGPSGEVYEEKKSLACSELSAMRSLLSKIDDEIALRSLLTVRE